MKPPYLSVIFLAVCGLVTCLLLLCLSGCATTRELWQTHGECVYACQRQLPGHFWMAMKYAPNSEMCECLTLVRDAGREADGELVTVIVPMVSWSPAPIPFRLPYHSPFPCKGDRTTMACQ